LKSEIFEAKEEIYGDWSGKYEVRVLTGAEGLAIEEKIFRYLQKKGITNPTIQNYPIILERTLGLTTSITKNGKPITGKDLNKMPKRLYTVLYGLYQKLNVPSQEEADFLSKQ